MNGFVIFTDIKGYSKLTEGELGRFVGLLSDLAPKLESLRGRSEVWNTWGDALFAVFPDAKPAVELALTYREYFKSLDFQRHGLRRLTPRIAGHFGDFFTFDDPLCPGKRNAVGTHVNFAARIEPVTRPGEIFVSEAFKHCIDNLSEQIQGISFGHLGKIELAKAFGILEVYRMYPSNEKGQQHIDRLIELDLGPVLPEPLAATAQEKRFIEDCSASESIGAFEAKIAAKNISTLTSSAVVELASVANKFGIYDRALGLLDFANDFALDADGITIHPHRHDTNLVKLRANCLTRMGKYEEAADIMYGLWKSGQNDSDTLSMLAAQYKRRALYGQDGRLLTSANINVALLDRSRSLYIEAFRRNISDYYPLINAAYLFSFPPIANREYTTKLSMYIEEAFQPQEDGNTASWWHAASLAEAAMLLHCTQEALDKFQKALSKHDPDNFMLASTKEQITIYAHLTNCYDEVKAILQALQPR